MRSRPLSLQRQKGPICRASPWPQPWGPASRSTPPRNLIRRIGAALEEKQFRYFLTGSFLSNVGSWMQSVAQAWLMFEISNSAFYLVLDGFANTIPISIFAFRSEE